MERTTLQKLISTLRGQLESDLLLGGVWLPKKVTGNRLQVTEAEALPVGEESYQVRVQEEGKTTESELMASQSKIQNPKSKIKKTASGDILEEKRRRLREVEEKLRKCHRCPLCETRTNLVPGEGNPDARIMFVGEAPGATEDEQGRPFVGRAGVLLTKIIEAMGLQREDVFIGNILKCRPPENRDPLQEEIEACINYLYEQIEIIQPEIIVALGAYASKTLLNRPDLTIGQLRGRVHEYVPGPMAEPIKLVATYHPAYVLRNYTQETRLRVWQDMQMVLKELGLPIPKGKK